MNRFGTTLIYILLGLNTLGVGYLITTKPATSSTLQTKINSAEMAQVDKIWSQVIEFRTELENLQGRVTFPNEKSKKQAEEYVQNHKMLFEQLRLEHLRVQDERTRDRATSFVSGTWGSNDFGIRIMNVPQWQFGKYNSVTEGYDLYQNVSLSKLENLNNEFRVMALSFMKDMK